jgi:hypothetical protein
MGIELPVFPHIDMSCAVTYKLVGQLPYMETNGNTNDAVSSK